MIVEDKTFLKLYSNILNKAWDNSDFKKLLLENPLSVLLDEGIQLPKGTKVRIDEGGFTQSYNYETKELVLPLPKKPDKPIDDSTIIEAGMICLCCHLCW